ncbi:hypothetical protein [Clostridium hydrogenum]|uniref:hypothetical protein n=1 Tax=Clostridium hydrogenum TaxID=2855764 RepID=UPI001F487C2F|nr:hypothetical protein [Clostridium hydrogenum]
MTLNFPHTIILVDTSVSESFNFKLNVEAFVGSAWLTKNRRMFEAFVGSAWLIKNRRMCNYKDIEMMSFFSKIQKITEVNMICDIVFIKNNFFDDNSNFIEMLDPHNKQKQSERNYAFIKVKYKNNNIFVPLRSNVNTNTPYGKIGFPVPSSKRPYAGLDFRKILIINDLSYIEYQSEPKLPTSQQSILNNSYDNIETMVIHYIHGYVKSALKNRHFRDKLYIFSTLHNFHKELGIS